MMTALADMNSSYGMEYRGMGFMCRAVGDITYYISYTMTLPQAYRGERGLSFDLMRPPIHATTD